MAKNLSFSRGDTVVLTLTLSVGGSPENLTGATVFFTAKDELSDADTAAAIRKSSGAAGGVTITDAVNGIASVQINPADTSAFPANETLLFYDVQLKRADGTIYTTAEGTICVYPDVTVLTT